MKILAIETSCDDTSAAIVKDGRYILSSSTNSQIEIHKKFGGVVPEVASRTHCENISLVVDKAISDSGLTKYDLDAIAVTYAPGLVGSLLVGVSFAKAFSFALKKPLIPVHHIKGHIAANYITYPELSPPFTALVISGGHSHIIKVKSYTKFKIIGVSRDDAIGEVYDKVARKLGFDYPGGRYIDESAQLGNPLAFSLPKPSIENFPFDFSFSGLKTATINLIHKNHQNGISNINDISASFQHTVCQIFIEKISKYIKISGEKQLVIAGGVACNSDIRKSLLSLSKKMGFKLFFPTPSLCTDNGAMIGSQAYYEFLQGNISDLNLNAISCLSVE